MNAVLSLLYRVVVEVIARAGNVDVAAFSGLGGIL